mmetsp:Transcript_34760/g.54308  ORF Transcript_34760/g.54308 Transcript_34760/m.54308 type:complete len:117 (-) Transcript_34760:1464-1814(-)
MDLAKQVAVVLSTLAVACLTLSSLLPENRVNTVELLGLGTQGLRGARGLGTSGVLVATGPQLVDRGIPWASPVTQGYPGETVMGFPYIEDQAQAGDVSSAHCMLDRGCSEPGVENK